MSSHLEVILRIRKEMEKLAANSDNSEADITLLLNKLKKINNVTLKLLQKSKIGFTVNKIRKSSKSEAVKCAAKSLLKDWQKIEVEHKDSSAHAHSSTVSKSSTTSDIAEPPGLPSTEMSGSGKSAVHWFRKGLRLHDNPALQASLRPGTDGNHLTLRPLFILDPWFVKQARVGQNRSGRTSCMNYFSTSTLQMAIPAAEPDRPGPVAARAGLQTVRGAGQAGAGPAPALGHLAGERELHIHKHYLYLYLYF